MLPSLLPTTRSASTTSLSISPNRRFRLRAEGEGPSTQPPRRGALSGKTGKELREEFFMAARTGSERGLPEGAFLNDNTTGNEPLTEITWEPYGDTCSAPQVSILAMAHRPGLPPNRDRVF